MHEYVLADRVLQSVLEESKSRGGVQVREVELLVGEMLGLTKESLTLAYSVVSKGTSVEGSSLKVKFTKGSVECSKCGYAGRLKVAREGHRVDPAFACPRCGASLRVKSGLELRITKIS